MTESARWRWVLLALSGLFATLVVRTAWLSDDAYITLRTVDNFVSGHGLRWNVVERVQSYTHPLWMLVVAVPYAVTREPYFTPLLLQVGLSLAAFGLLASRLAAVPAAAAFGLLVLCFSKAFVEYSTSGLENPLTHLLLVVFFVSLWRPAGNGQLTLLWLAAALLMVNRLDTGLLVLPALTWASWRAGWRATVPAAAVGLLPLAAWEAFSVVYYGFPFPNTAYAKLQTGYTTAAMLGQGARYFLDSILRDPVTLPATAVLSVMAVAVRPRESAAIVAGMALYAIYVLRIGGDFMSGRFFSALLLCAVVLGARTPWRLPRWATVAAVAAVVVLGTFVATRPPITSGANTFILSGDEGMGVGQVADERAFYYRYTGLLRWTKEIPLPHNEEEVRGRRVRAAGDRVVVQASIGLFGFFAGPEVHIVDPLALADPLLARLPAKLGMRVGHYERELPEGYVETLATGRNVIADPAVAAAYERLRWVTQGPLWTHRRWRTIRALNLGTLFP